MDLLEFQSLKGIRLYLANKLTALSTDLFVSIPKRDYLGWSLRTLRFAASLIMTIGVEYVNAYIRLNKSKLNKIA